MATIAEIDNILNAAESRMDIAKQMKDKETTFNFEIFRAEAIAYLNTAKWLLKEKKK